MPKSKKIINIINIEEKHVKNQIHKEYGSFNSLFFLTDQEKSIGFMHEKKFIFFSSDAIKIWIYTD